MKTEKAAFAGLGMNSEHIDGCGRVMAIRTTT
jgi:hypothetical protein